MTAFLCFWERVIKLATVGAGRIEETPGYCKAEDLANLFGFSPQNISQYTRDGILRKEDTPVGKRYNVVKSTRAVIQYLLDKADGREGKDSQKSKKLEILNAEARIAQAKALLAEEEAQQLSGWPI